MRYPLVATDMDGTLLNSNLNISNYTKKIIKEYQRRGGTFAVSTGRMYSSFYNTIKRLGLENVPVIAYQGAYIKDTNDGNVLYHKTIPVKYAVEILKALEYEQIILQIYYDDKLFIKEDTPETCLYKKVCEVNAIILGQTLSDYVENNNIEITKVLGIADKHKVKELYNRYTKTYEKELDFHISHPNFFECVAKGVNKGDAVSYLCKRMGLSANDVITFGDNYNDIPMLKFAKLSFAVENANEDVKKAAKYVCPSNDNDGVAKMIEKYCL